MTIVSGLKLVKINRMLAFYIHQYGTNRGESGQTDMKSEIVIQINLPYKKLLILMTFVGLVEVLLILLMSRVSPHYEETKHYLIQ